MSIKVSVWDKILKVIIAVPSIKLFFYLCPNNK